MRGGNFFRGSCLCLGPCRSTSTGILAPGHDMLAVLPQSARLFLASFALLGLAACGGGSTQPATSPEPQPTATVNATNSLQFTPTTVLVTVGGTVTFKFGSIEHTLFF